MIIYLTNNLLDNKKAIYTYFIDIAIIILMAMRLISFYNDFNNFNSLRDKYIKEQYSNGYKYISCVQYDNKYNYFFVDRLTSFDSFFCNSPYYRYILNDDEIYLYNSYEQLR